MTSQRNISTGLTGSSGLTDGIDGIKIMFVYFFLICTIKVECDINKSLFFHISASDNNPGKVKLKLDDVSL